MPAGLSDAQRLLVQRKFHVADGVYAQSGRGVQARFSSGWGAALAAARLLGALPETAIRWWTEQPGGHLLLTAGGDAYKISLSVEGEALHGVAALPIGWLVEDEARALAAALRPLDHLLGCGGAADAPWLSDGGGISPRWQRIGAQIAQLFALGYGASEASRQDPHVYLAEGLALALTDRQALNVNDPKLERLLVASLLSEGFWRRNSPPLGE